MSSSPWGRGGHRQRWAVRVSVGWLAFICLVALTASWLPLHPNDQDLRHSNEGPSWRHLFGTTRLGEDLLAKVVHGSRVSLIVAACATLIALVGGGLLGLASGYFRGLIDAVITTLLDALSAFPALVLAVALVLFLGPGLLTVTVVVGVLTVPVMARVARVATREVSERLFVDAARTGGATAWRVLRVEIVPNIVVPVMSYALVVSGIAMLAEGALSFLGVGVGVTKTSWGQLVAAGQGALVSEPHLSLFPAAALFVTVLAVNLLGDQLTAGWAGLAPLPDHHEARVPPATAASAPPRRGPDRGVASGARLAVSGLTVWVDSPAGPLAVVDGVDLGLAPGATLGIVGESGSGKTMLARGIIGVMPPGVSVDPATEVFFDGVDLRSLSPRQARARRGRAIALVSQDPMTALDPVMRVGDAIAELVRCHLRASRGAARRRSVELLAEVGIAEPAARARSYPHELSGGMRQRVAIAMALAGEPSVLIADEPTSALDVTTQAQILNLLDRLRHDRGMSLVLISHDLSLVAARADHVAVLYAGQIVEYGPAGELFGRPRMPYTAALLAARPTPDGPAHQRLAALGGYPPPAGLAPPGCSFAPRCPRATDACRSESPSLHAEGERAYRCIHPLDAPA